MFLTFVSEMKAKQDSRGLCVCVCVCVCDNLNFDPYIRRGSVTNIGSYTTGQDRCVCVCVCVCVRVRVLYSKHTLKERVAYSSCAYLQTTIIKSKA